jgi:hypothetical protein
LHAPVDIVAEEYQPALPVFRVLSGIVGYLRQQLGDQVEPAMNVADGVDSEPGRNCGG